MLWKMLHALLGYIVFVLLQKEKCVVLHFWNLFESFFKSLCKILLFVNDGLSWAALGSGQRQGSRKEYKRSVSSSLIFIVLFLHSKRVSVLVEYPSWSVPVSRVLLTPATRIFYWMPHLINKEGQISVNVWTENTEGNLVNIGAAVRYLHIVLAG